MLGFLVKDHFPDLDCFRKQLDALGLVQSKSELLVGLLPGLDLTSELFPRVPGLLLGSQHRRLRSGILLAQPFERKVYVDEVRRCARFPCENRRNYFPQIPLLLDQRLTDTAVSLLLEFLDHVC